MTSRLVNIGVLLALLLSGGGGSLAASLCPHADCASGPAVVSPAAEHHGEEAAAGDHQGHTPEAAGGRHHEAPSGARETASRETRRGVQSTHDSSCYHCLARRPAAPAAEFERRSDAPRRDDRVAPAPSSRPAAPAPPAVFAREVTPHQGAPPGRTSRHVLNNVFRI